MSTSRQRITMFALTNTKREKEKNERQRRIFRPIRKPWRTYFNSLLLILFPFLLSLSPPLIISLRWVYKMSSLKQASKFEISLHCVRTTISSRVCDFYLIAFELEDGFRIDIFGCQIYILPAHINKFLMLIHD